MRVFLTGASGFIGGHIVLALSQRGHHVTCLVRGRGAETLRRMNWPGVTLVEGEFTAPESYVQHLAGHEVLINAVGIIRETATATFESVHERAPIALFEAAARAGIRRIVQISALGADDAARSHYHLSKRAADHRLATLSVDYVVLRPSFVYGPQDQSMTFFLSLAALPLSPIPGDGQYRVQPVHVDDVVHAVVLAVERPELRSLVVDVGGAEAIPFDEMIDTLARRLGKPKAHKLHISWPVMSLAAAVTDACGGRGPITGEELGMLRRGNHADNTAFIQYFGFTPLPFETGLARKPLTQADRWHARLTHLRIPLSLTVAFIWIATGFISAFLSVDRGRELLAGIGIAGPLADVALFGTSYFEIAIGLATAVGWRVRLMGVIQLLLMAGFTIILSAGMPELWLHPFGPLTKNIPLIGATLVMMALEE